MQDLLSIGTNRRESMIGTGIGLGMSGYRLPTIGFTPDKVFGLQMWFDAADLTTVFQSIGGSLASADGDPVGYWTDKSGNGRHASQSDGTKKPQIKLNTINGKPSIKMDGLNDVLTITPYEPSNLTIISVCIRRTASSFLTLSEGTTNGPLLIWFGASDLVYYWYSNSAQVNFAGGDESGTFIISRSFNGATNEVITRKNGADWNTVTRSGGREMATVGGSGDWWASDGSFAEFLVYDKILSQSDMNKIETYLNSKWGVY